MAVCTSSQGPGGAHLLPIPGAASPASSGPLVSAKGKSTHLLFGGRQVAQVWAENPLTYPTRPPSSGRPPSHRPTSQAPHLLHCGVAAGKLLAEVGDVVVTLLHVFLEVLPEVHQGLLHLAVKLWRRAGHTQDPGHPLQASAGGGHLPPPQLRGGPGQWPGPLGTAECPLMRRRFGKSPQLARPLLTAGWTGWCLELPESLGDHLLPPLSSLSSWEGSELPSRKLSGGKTMPP